MAIGCLWSTSWLGADAVEAAVKTPQAISLYLASQRLASSTSMVPPRLVAVQLHLATVSTLSIRTTLFLTLPLFRRPISSSACTGTQQPGSLTETLDALSSSSAFINARRLVPMGLSTRNAASVSGPPS